MHRYATQVAEWDVAVSVLADEDYRDIELLSIRPNPTTDAELDRAKFQFAQRGLMWRGVAGISDGDFQFILEAAPTPCDVEGWAMLRDALTAHCNAVKHQEVRYLRYLWSLPDSRSELAR